MKELKDIFKAYQSNDSESYALATIVEVNGSHYRKAGARALFTRHRSVAGSISAGCLEADLLIRAQSVITTGQPTLTIYDTTAENDIIWGLNLGCGGEVKVLLEKLPDSAENSYLAFLNFSLDKKAPAALATVFAVSGSPGIQIGDRFAYATNLGRAFKARHSPGSAKTQDGLQIIETLHNDCRNTIIETQSRCTTYENNSGSYQVFLEYISPAPQLCICGTGSDIVPLITFASELGWETIVVDSPTGSSTNDNFSRADRIVRCQPEDLCDNISFSDRSAAVILTHNYEKDLKLLKTLLPSPVKYVGLIGSRTRTRRLINEMLKRPAQPGEFPLEKLYSPAGIDIGSETPEEIALSIVAEIKAVLGGTSPGFLRDNNRSTLPAHIQLFKTYDTTDQKREY